MRTTKLTIAANRKKPSVPQVQHQEDVRDYDTDSPPYSPTLSEMERPSFHPQTIFDLRQACAILVNETNPPDPDDESDHRETLRKIEADRKAKHAAQARAAEAKAQKSEYRELKSAKPRKEEAPKDQPKRFSSARPAQNVREATPKPTAYQPTQVAQQQGLKQATTGFGANDGNRRLLVSHNANAIMGEPLEPTHTKVLSAKAQGKQKEVTPPEDSMIYEIHQSVQDRPKPSAAATVDYVGEHSDSSRSTSRSASNFAPHRTSSTGLTSLALTPGEEKRRSHNRRPSDESYQEELARKESEGLMREKFAQRQAEQQYSATGPARPASRSSKLSRMTSRSDLGDRPISRAGSIAGSIADSISNYIRPRASSSADSIRSGRSSVTSDRSRSSSMSRSSTGRQGFFRRNSLRRKGSWASFRSARPDQEEKNTKKNGEPNLNRPLPALPGLDSYRETKTHIGQLMKGATKKAVKKKHIGDPQPLVAPQTLYTATLPKPATPILDRHQLQYFQQDNDERTYQYDSQYHPDPTDQPRRSTFPKNMASQHLQYQQQSQYQQQQNQDHQLPAKRSSSIPNFAFPRKSSDSRSENSQNLSKTTSNITNPRSPTQGAGKRLHQGPPTVRGPSYHKEMEAGMYPRPMEVSHGPNLMNGDYYNVKLVDVGPETRNGSGANGRGFASSSEAASPMQSPAVGGGHDEHGNWERKGGLKGRMGRMFGSSNSRPVAAN